MMSVFENPKARKNKIKWKPLGFDASLYRKIYVLVLLRKILKSFNPKNHNSDICLSHYVQSIA